MPPLPKGGKKLTILVNFRGDIVANYEKYIVKPYFLYPPVTYGDSPL